MIELFPLNTPDCISSLERKPFPGRNVVYEEPILFDELNNEYNNPCVKWNDRGCIGSFRETENLITDSENLTTNNWDLTQNITATLTDYYFNNHRFTKLSVTSTSSAYWGQFIYPETGLISGNIVIKIGDTEGTIAWRARDYTTATTLFSIEINPDTKSVTTVTGTLVMENWYDDIVELSVISGDSVTSGDSVATYIYPDIIEDTSDYIYVTAWSIEDNAYPTPYTPTSRDTSELAYPFEWSQQGTIECWVRPWFTYNTSNEKWIASNYNSDYTPNYNIALLYESSEDKWRAVFWDGSSKIDLYSSQITSNTQLWKWWHMKITWDTINDDYHFYIDGVSVGDTTATLTTIDFNNNIFIGSIPKYTSPDNFTFNGFITNLLYKDYVDTSTEHYEKNIPYINRMETLGKNNLWKIM